MVATYQRIIHHRALWTVVSSRRTASARARTRGSIGMRAEARRSWHPAFARWFGEKSEADAAKASATRRPTRLGFARIAESVVPDARVATPAPLFELALKCVPPVARARPVSEREPTRPRAPSPRALGREPRSARARASPPPRRRRDRTLTLRAFSRALRVIRKTSGRPSPGVEEDEDRVLQGGARARRRAVHVPKRWRSGSRTSPDATCPPRRKRPKPTSCDSPWPSLCAARPRNAKV